MTATRNQIYDALLALGAGAPFATPMAESSRRFKLFDQCEKPALFQLEPDENYRAREGRLRIRTFHVTWVFYTEDGQNPAATPAMTTSNILDVLDALFPEGNATGERQTLGGLVFHVAIEGSVKKYEGDLDGQTIITVPLVIVVP